MRAMRTPRAAVEAQMVQTLSLAHLPLLEEVGGVGVIIHQAILMGQTAVVVGVGVI